MVVSIPDYGFKRLGTNMNISIALVDSYGVRV